MRGRPSLSLPWLLAALVAALPACSGRSPQAPTASAVTGVVFYDENGNGAADAGEEVRVPGVLVRAGGRSTVSTSGGAFALDTVPAGAVVEVPDDGLPPFFTAGPARITATGAALRVPLRLPIGSNRPNVYMAFGDSITAGQGSDSGRGYRGPLAERLARHFGRAVVVDQGSGGERSDEGLARLEGALREVQPAYTLIEYGTNDYSRECRKLGECATFANLRALVRAARAASSLPVLSTVLPGNPVTVPDALDEVRHRWVLETNEGVRTIARDEGAVVADTYAAFVSNPDSRRLFTDYLHPNDRGYEVIAETFFRAITEPRGSVPGR